MDRIKQGRWLGYVDNLAIYAFLVPQISCVLYCVSDDVHLGGALIGILIGILVSGFYLLYLRRSARKKRFLIRAYKDNGKSLKVLFIACILIGLTGGYFYGELKDKYPEIRIEDAVIAGMLFGLSVFGGLSLAGIHWLQRCYGYRFYIAKTEQEAEEVASRCGLEGEGSNTYGRRNDSRL
jgi:hypothetical protein